MFIKVNDTVYKISINRCEVNTKQTKSWYRIRISKLVGTFGPLAPSQVQYTQRSIEQDRHCVVNRVYSTI